MTDALERGIEELTHRLGREMLERARSAEPGPLSLTYWQECALRELTRNEAFKVQAFRFVDVLPMLRDPAQVGQRLREYFSPEQLGRVPTRTPLDELRPNRDGWLHRVAAGLAQHAPTRGISARLVAWVAHQVAASMARTFVAGETPQQAERVVRRWRARGLAFTIDVLGEAALSPSESAHYQGVYMRLLEDLPRSAAAWPEVPLIDRADGAALPRVNVSVKLSALHSGLESLDVERSKAIAKEQLRPILRRAREVKAHVHVDMEHYAVKALTLEICRELFNEPEFRDYPHLGVVLQAYLRETEADVEDMLAWAANRGTPIWVRLVKGAYWDTETVLAAQRGWPCPVWSAKWQSDACYERIARRLCQNHRLLYTAFASHNVRSLAHAMALKQVFEVPDAAFEFQMLYGMGDTIKQAAVEMGQRTRVYAPYGEMLAGMAYLIRRLLENTANESFLRTAAADVPDDDLLRNPHETGRFARPVEAAHPLKLEDGAPVPYDFENAPNTDFLRAENRARLETALHNLKASGPRDVRPLVGENERMGVSRPAYNPSSVEEVVANVFELGADAVPDVVRTARNAFDDWSAQDLEQRAAILLRAADELESRRFELAALAVRTCARPWREADGDVSEAVDYLRYFAHEATRQLAPRRRDVPGEANEYRHMPRGVVVALGPWDFPLSIPAGMLAAALVTGNSVIFKPASTGAVVGRALIDVLRTAGAPAGAVNFCPGPGPRLGHALVQADGVDMVVMAGRSATGLQVRQAALEADRASGRRADSFGGGVTGQRHVLLAMGGKNALIIDDDADVDDALRAVLDGAFAQAGQKCTACSRVIILDGCYEKFVRRLVDAASTWSARPADEPGSVLTPMIDDEAYRVVQSFIELGHKQARCVLDGTKPAAGFRSLGPVIFADVAADSPLATEEIHGPMLCVMRARDIDEAIRLFNSTPYALCGGLFSRSPAHIARAARECECGNFYVNRAITGSRVDRQPFGGLRLSGSGVMIGGPDYLKQFCVARTITENTIRRGFAPRTETAATA